MSTVSNSDSPRINIHTRQVELDPVWLEHVRARMAELTRFDSEIASFDVEIDYNSKPSRQSTAWHIDIAVALRNKTLRASAEAGDPERAFEHARAIAERNLLKAGRKSNWSRHGSKATLKLRNLLSR